VHNNAVFSIRAFVFTMFSLAAVLAISVAAAQAPPTVWDGVYTEEQAKRGGGLYQVNCAPCHGDTLLGAEAAPPLVGDQFNSTWDGVPLIDLLNRIRTTMPQTAPGTLSSAQAADVLAYILQFGKFPAGDAPLASQTVGAAAFRAFKP
jgi:mono/diheme cytochrome c family protein